jgi:hypothetical protein
MKLISLAARSFLSLAIMCGAVAIATAQNEKPSPAPMPIPSPTPRVANPADVNSIDAIIAAVYDVISGPAGKNAIGIACVRSLFPAHG